MIYTDRQYNRLLAEEREQRILCFEKELNDLSNRMFDNTALCTPENSSRLNWLASQIEIMKGNRVVNINYINQ